MVKAFTLEVWEARSELDDIVPGERPKCGNAHKPYKFFPTYDILCSRRSDNGGVPRSGISVAVMEVSLVERTG